MYNLFTEHNIESVIFDLDGSLVDSMWMWDEIDREYLARFNIEVPGDLHEKIEGLSIIRTAEYFKMTFKISDSISRICHDWNEMAYDKYMHEVPMKPGAMDFIDCCSRHGIKLGIASSNSDILIRNVLTVHGILDRFMCIRSGMDVPNGKPEPDIYNEVASILKTKAENCLVFEDVVQGIIAGKRAGMTVVAVDDSFSDYQIEEKKRLSDYYIKSYDEISFD